MYISEFKYNLKPGVDINELKRLWEEMGLPTYQKIPGLLYMTTLKYTEKGDHSAPEWDYVWLEVWKDKEALDNAHRNDLFSGAGAWYEKFLGMVEKLLHHHAVSVSVYQNK